VDQTTFGPGVFFWFFVIGGLTVVMAGGVSPRPKPVPRPEPLPADLFDAAERDTTARNGEESRRQVTLDEVPPEPEPDPQPETEPGAVAGPEPDPAPPPPPVRPAPDLEDVEDLMFVDADIDADIDADGDQPRAGTE